MVSIHLIQVNRSKRIFSFGIKEQLMLMLQNVNDVNQRVHPHCRDV